MQTEKKHVNYLKPLGGPNVEDLNFKLVSTWLDEKANKHEKFLLKLMLKE